MRTTRFGATGLDLPVIGLGTAEYLGGSGPINAALDAGVRLIDTAESYGTERQVGPAVADRRGDAFIATKVSAAHFAHDDILAAADRSLRALGTDRIDLYQLHWPSDAIPLEETLAAMDHLVDQGKVRFLGVCNFPVALLQRAAALSRHGIQSNQLAYGPAHPGLGDGMRDWCRRNAVTLIAYSPLARGLEALLASPAGPALQAVADELGWTVAQAALAWTVADPGVIAIPKTRRRERIAENARAGALVLPEAARVRIDAACGAG